MRMHRRDFLGGMTAAAATSLSQTRLAVAEGAPETTSITLARSPTICVAPQFICQELLHAEGFNEIRYVETLAPDVPEALAQGKLDFSMAYASQFAAALDEGMPLTVLAGIMVGCFELFANDGVRGIVRKQFEAA